ncbi:hypothetical protein FB390_1826 [Nocardia bhagyanarayanae]|uniref:Uncharacterized protein n=1 Tax=Nocardia bhagyanarayanae TaxID=1215925 RepID=A0A543F8N6_9NOCA|nr:hypothetical protein FB390_1826 [Nocardia bhagyanarayanae]
MVSLCVQGAVVRTTHGGSCSPGAVFWVRAGRARGGLVSAVCDYGRAQQRFAGCALRGLGRATGVPDVSSVSASAVVWWRPAGTRWFQCSPSEVAWHRSDAPSGRLRFARRSYAGASRMRPSWFRCPPVCDCGRAQQRSLRFAGCALRGSGRAYLRVFGVRQRGCAVTSGVPAVAPVRPALLCGCGPDAPRRGFGVRLCAIAVGHSSGRSGLPGVRCAGWDGRRAYPTCLRCPPARLCVDVGRARRDSGSLTPLCGCGREAPAVVRHAARVKSCGAGSAVVSAFAGPVGFIPRWLWFPRRSFAGAGRTRTRWFVSVACDYGRAQQRFAGRGPVASASVGRCVVSVGRARGGSGSLAQLCGCGRDAPAVASVFAGLRLCGAGEHPQCRRGRCGVGPRRCALPRAEVTAPRSEIDGSHMVANQDRLTTFRLPSNLFLYRR